MNFINDFMKNHSIVDMERFIQQTPKEFLSEISCYCIKGLNWKGTEWEKD